MSPTENTKILETPEVFQQEDVKNNDQSGNFSEKTADLIETNEKTDVFTLQAQENVQKSAIFQAENSKSLSEFNTITDRVSEIYANISDKNLSKNAKILSDEEDNALFSSLFPGVKRESVEKDPNFMLFANGKDKNKPFCSLYGEYIALVGKIREEITMRGVVAMKNKLSSPGSLSSEKSPENDYFTRDQVLKMNKEQISRNYNKIRESQQKW
ncbi:MAG: hypothetical protein IJ437_07170 [Clostridia bacterium]|nr:hypothetical protein [Clostridia bacterium]